MMLNVKRKFGLFLQCERGVAFVEFALSVSILIFLFLGTVELSRYVLVLQKLQYAVDKETNIISSISANDVASGAPFDAPTLSGMAGTPTLDLMLAPYSFENVGLLVLSDIFYDPLNTDATHPNGQATVEWRLCSSTSLQGTLATKNGTNANVDSSTGLVTENPDPSFNGQSVIQSLTPDSIVNGSFLVKGTYSKFGQVGKSADLSAYPTLAAVNGFNPGDEIITAEIYFAYTPVVTAQFIAPNTIYTAALSAPRYGSLFGLVWSGQQEGFRTRDNPSALYSNSDLLKGPNPGDTGVWTNCP